jgi:Icc-related predicted phosphoesterase
MRILAVSDLHYTLPQFDWLIKNAPGHDVLIIAGDLLDIASALDLDSQILVIQQYLNLLGALLPVLVTSGNHDGDQKTPAGEFVARWLKPGIAPGITVDGQNADFGSLRFTLCPWWDGPETRSLMDEHLSQSRPSEGHDWVWIHHAPPLGCRTAWTGKKDAGDEHLLGLIRQWRPAAVLAGHIHNAPFRTDGSWSNRLGSTWIFNPGRQIGPVPTHLVFDWPARAVTYSSLEGIHTLNLRDGTST